MQFRQVGRSDLRVSTVAMGCWAIAGDSTWGPQEEAESIRTIHAALDAGINFFDTAEAYGDGYSEELLGRALAGRRDKAVIATKFNSSCSTAESVQEACEMSLKRLAVEKIDLYQVHWRNRDLPLEDLVRTLENLVRSGKIRYYGVCNFGLGDLREFLPLGAMISNQLPYSLLWRAIEEGIVDECRNHGVSILPYSPLAWALLTGKFRSPEEVPESRARTRHYSSARPQVRHGEPGAEAETFAAVERIREISAGFGQPMADVSLAWLLHQKGVTSVLAGARTPQQIQENVAASDLKLPEDVLRQLDEATRPLKEKLGPNADMWQGAGASRFR